MLVKTPEDNLVIFGEHDDATLVQIKTCTATGEYGVLCADGHKGYAQPIGGVVAYKNKISISGVGFDIACGNMAIHTDAMEDEVKLAIPALMPTIAQEISFGVGRTNKDKLDHPLFDEPLWSLRPWKDWKSTARDQLGTVGSGNHYVDIFADELGRIWVGVHFGSRGLGHKTATYFLKAAGGKDGMDVPPTVVPEDSDLGHDYLCGMELAGKYAYAGREYVARKVVRDILQVGILEEIHNHHNYAWQEKHFEEQFWVVRKGSTPLFPSQKGFVGGSMGDNAVIVEGVESEASEKALYSTVHGAGRIMSRTAAKGKFVKDDRGRKIRTQGLVRHDAMCQWLKEKGVFLVGGDVDEAPQAYRRLDAVLEIHSETFRILHTLRPLGVAMAGIDVIDPYKD